MNHMENPVYHRTRSDYHRLPAVVRFHFDGGGDETVEKREDEEEGLDQDLEEDVDDMRDPQSPKDQLAPNWYCGSFR